MRYLKSFYESSFTDLSELGFTEAVKPDQEAEII